MNNPKPKHYIKKPKKNKQKHEKIFKENSPNCFLAHYHDHSLIHSKFLANNKSFAMRFLSKSSIYSIIYIITPKN